MRRYLTITAMTAMLFACGKKDPEPTPPATGEPAKTTEPAKTDPAAAGAGESKTKEDNGGGVGKQDDKPVSGTDPVAPQPVAKPPQPAGPLAPAGAPPVRGALTPESIATFPPEIVSVGGTPSLKMLVDALVEQARRIPGFQVPPDPIGGALQMIQQQSGMDLSWVDVDRPLRFAVPDPKQYPNGSVVLVPEKAGAALAAKALPGATEGNGHFLTLKLPDREIFFDRVVDGHLLLTSHGDLAKKLEGFAKELAGWTPKDPLVVDTSVENATRIFADDIKKMKDTVNEMGGMLAGDPRAAQMMEMATGGLALVEGMQRMAFSLDPAGDFPRIGLVFKGLPGSPMEKVAKDLAGRKIAFGGAVPADAWFAIGYDLPNAGWAQDAKELADAITNAGMGRMPITWSDEEKQKLVGLLTQMQELQGGQGMFWLRQEGTVALIIESVGSSKDGKALKQIAVDIGDFFYKKAWAEGRKAMIAQGAPADQLPAEMAFKDFLTLVGKNTGAMGITPSLASATTAGGNEVNALDLAIDWSRLPLQGPAKAVGDVIGSRLGVAVAGEGERYVFVVGPDAAKRAARVIDETATAATQTDPWLAKANEAAFFTMFKPARLLRALVDVVPDLAAGRELIMALPDDPVVISATSDGTQLSIEGVLPARVIAGFGAGALR